MGDRIEEIKDMLEHMRLASNDSSVARIYVKDVEYLLQRLE